MRTNVASVLILQGRKVFFTGFTAQKRRQLQREARGGGAEIPSGVPAAPTDVLVTGSLRSTAPGAKQRAALASGALIIDTLRFYQLLRGTVRYAQLRWPNGEPVPVPSPHVDPLPLLTAAAVLSQLFGNTTSQFACSV